MPLPKPSKMISKRFKKPRPALPPASSSSSPLLPLSSSCEQPWPTPHPLREWKIRVVCTDPDATDDSSSDEAQPSPSISSSSSPSRRKRLIREFSLPLPSPPSPPSTPQPCRSVCRRPRPRLRSHVPDLSTVATETATLADAGTAGDACPPSAVDSSPADNDNEEEEFARFLQEFLPAQEEECEWEFGRSSRSEPLFGSCGVGEMLDLELDSEALSWINSMQRLP